MISENDNTEKWSVQEDLRYTDYQSLYAIVQRCSNENNRHYKNYGGRGIKVCRRYKKVKNIVIDIGLKPSKDYTIGRIDNDGHYSCGKCEECSKKGWNLNVRWETRIQQNRNTRRNRLLEYNGETKTMAEWAEIAGIPYEVFSKRISRYKWTMEKAMTIPLLNKGSIKGKWVTSKDSRLLTYNGETKPVTEWARILGIHHSSLLSRLERGWSMEKVMTTPRKESYVRR